MGCRSGRWRSSGVEASKWRTRAGALRDPYYIVAAVAGFIGLVCVVIGLAGLLQARRRAWLATAIRPDGVPVESAPPR